MQKPADATLRGDTLIPHPPRGLPVPPTDPQTQASSGPQPQPANERREGKVYEAVERQECFATDVDADPNNTVFDDLFWNMRSVSDNALIVE